MIATIVTAPASEPITTSEAKTHLNIDLSFEDDDAYIGALISVCRRKVEQVTRRRLFTQTWKLWLQRWPEGDHILLPFGQLQSVTHVKYYDTDNAANTWDSSEYVVDTDQEPGRIVLDYSEKYPSETLHPKNPIEIQFVCGWTTTAAIPDEIRHAIKIMLADLYEHRESEINEQMHRFDHIKALLAPHILWWRGNGEVNE